MVLVIIPLISWLHPASGVIRNGLGHWIFGFTKFIGWGNAIRAELWALVIGLQPAITNHCLHLIVEIDSKVVLELLNDSSLPTSHHLFPFVHCCRDLAGMLIKVKFVHTFWTPPAFVEPCFMANLAGACFTRRIGLAFAVGDCILYSLPS
ncbi:putative ribonuclease H-like domain-containing protein [Senna tora]|uniref:Putative ribonuclease H-like domain-containing protein n=1 Tax=Senna tora TaxID=362788 RepID=A0A834SRW6_9FABA|nr:putative ribonuclease H-like domain-containing protein [Senna tora]